MFFRTQLDFAGFFVCFRPDVTATLCLTGRGVFVYSIQSYCDIRRIFCLFFRA